MIYMVPYEKPFYFILLAITFLPYMVALYKGKRWLWYQSLLTIFFLFISFGGVNQVQGFALIGYVVYQMILMIGYGAYRKNKNNSMVFYIAVILAILPLGLVKVIPFVTAKSSIFGFLGISYLTFKVVEVIMDQRDGSIKTLRPDYLLHYLLFFPTISSGPIDRYPRFTKELAVAPDQEVYMKLVIKGIHNIFMGFLYKFILAYLLGSHLLPFVSQTTLDADNKLFYIIAYMYVYSLYLFFDFAGYSLFAVGASYLLGYETPINFNKPFLSTNIKDFWNRWHMSLSFWFRDFVYMRLMYTLMKKKVFKSRIVTSNIGYFALFLLMGIWHGLTWYYLVYGLYHAALICITDAWIRYKKKHKKQIPSNKFTKIVSIVLTGHAVAFSFLIFSGFLDTLLKV